MALYKQKGSNRWWYKFNWDGEQIRKSTKQTNKRVAEQMEAAHKAALAKGEVGIRERKAVPTLTEFADLDFLPFVESRFANKPKTLEYYKNGLKRLKDFSPLAKAKLDAIPRSAITEFIEALRSDELQVSSINRVLEVLRRMLRLSLEWGKTDKVPPKIQMLPGENERDRVLTEDEERRYLAAAKRIGVDIEDAYQRALAGVRAKKGEAPIAPEDPYLLRDATTILIDCALRPEECFRLRWQNLRDGALHVSFGEDRERAKERAAHDPCVGIAGDAPRRPPGRMGVSGANSKRPHRKIDAQETAQESSETVESGGVYALHSSPYLPHQMVVPHGSVHSGVLGRSQRFFNHKALRSPASGDSPRRDGASTRRKR